MSNTFIDVHTFDGKLKNIFKPSREYTINEKRKCFVNLIRNVNSSGARHTITMIISDLNKNKGPNYQLENDIDSSDILMDILENCEIDKIIVNLSEQLEDIQTMGSCSSGRVTRLLQIWLAFNQKIKS